MTTTNQPAPDFKLRSTAGEYQSLSSLRGQTVILAFFPAAFTGVCQAQLCTFNDSLSKLNESNAKVFGISVDGPLALGAFGSQNNIAFPLLSDHQRTTITDYDITIANFAATEGYTVAKRSVFIIDAEGMIRYRWIAPNPGVEPNYDEVIQAAASLSA